MSTFWQEQSPAQLRKPNLPVSADCSQLKELAPLSPWLWWENGECGHQYHNLLQPKQVLHFFSYNTSATHLTSYLRSWLLFCSRKWDKRNFLEDKLCWLVRSDCHFGVKKGFIKIKEHLLFGKHEVLCSNNDRENQTSKKLKVEVKCWIELVSRKSLKLQACLTKQDM